MRFQPRRQSVRDRAPDRVDLRDAWPTKVHCLGPQAWAAQIGVVGSAKRIVLSKLSDKPLPGAADSEQLSPVPLYLEVVPGVSAEKQFEQENQLQRQRPGGAKQGGAPRLEKVHHAQWLVQ